MKMKMKMIFGEDKYLYIQTGMIAHTEKNASHEGMKEEVIKTVSTELTDLKTGATA